MEIPTKYDIFVYTEYFSRNTHLFIGSLENTMRPTTKNLA